MHILLIEDDKIIGESLVHIFQDKKFNVDWFEDGESCIIAVKNQNFDVIILDLNLPDISGEKLIQIIRQQKKINPYNDYINSQFC